MTEKQLKNKELIDEFPFLLPRNKFTGEVPQDYDYTYTELDAMPEGWRKAFGIKLCKELKEALGDSINKYMITQIKEKYGTLCWYDCGNTEEGMKVIDKYFVISQETCIKCGKPATKCTDGWINYLCDKCYEEHLRRINL